MVLWSCLGIYIIWHWRMPPPHTHTLWVVPFPGWNPGSCKWKQGIEQQHAFISFCFLIVDVLWTLLQAPAALTSHRDELCLGVWAIILSHTLSLLTCFCWVNFITTTGKPKIATLPLFLFFLEMLSYCSPAQNPLCIPGWSHTQPVWIPPTPGPVLKD